MVFMLAVLLSRHQFGVWPAIYASLLSFLVYNFFFIPPLYTFTVAEPYELLALVIFLVVAIVTSAMAGRVRDQATCRRESGPRHAPALRVHASAFGPRDAANGSRRRPRRRFMRVSARPVVVLLAARRRSCSDRLLAAGRRARYRGHDGGALGLQHAEPAGADTGTLPIIPWYFVPLRIGDEDPRRASGSRRTRATPPFDSEVARLARYASPSRPPPRWSGRACARDGSSQDGDRNGARAQHAAGVDLPRFPDASVLHSWRSDQPDRATATSLTPPAQADLLGADQEESEDLDRMVRNLLAITRIDAGALELRRDWIDLARNCPSAWPAPRGGVARATHRHRDAVRTSIGSRRR